MEVAIHLPDDIARRVQAQWEDVPRHALESLALAWYQSRHPSITNLQASSISLQRISWYETKWAYQVFLVPPEEARPFAEPEDSIRTIVVLLDGTFVEPVIDPDAKRRPQINL